MTWASRAKLFVGLILVLALTAGATLIFNQRQSQAASTSAQLAAQLYDVGTDYGGVVTEAYVKEGDEVREGERMFAVRSLQLERDIAAGVVSADPASMAADGTFTVRATAPGTVSTVDLGEGSYAAAGSVLATIDGDGSLFAQAQFLLTPRDFARVAEGAAVTLRLPDGEEFSGTVTDLTVETVDGTAHVTAALESEELAKAPAGPLLKPGTPLEATLALRDDGPLAPVHDALSDFARKIGL